ncbi:hypothetical protein PUN28_002496 [Cardiocondyla obscurior]|uniref:Uncharacterized protein n=1 Tax=Cardiocondyla obscurior TaxID=286306 RepID=A0AAW2GUU4_9HYME
MFKYAVVRGAEPLNCRATDPEKHVAEIRARVTGKIGRQTLFSHVLVCALNTAFLYCVTSCGTRTRKTFSIRQR